jgi:S-formylglutathione hydrolase FrmB
MLDQELLPLLAKRGLRTDRYGLLGWSMGGFGALLFAEHDSAVAVGALSPALYRHFGDAAAGAFDNEQDFAGNRVRGDGLKDVAVRIDCGRDDPFAGAARELREDLNAAGGQQAGAHTPGYWRRMVPDQLRFLGEKLAT